MLEALDKLLWLLEEELLELLELLMLL